MLKAGNKLPHPRLHAAAVEEAQTYLHVKAGTAGAAGAAATAHAAAAAAAAVNSMPRCRKCEACVNLMSSGKRRCLLVRAYAAAAAGHTGAQVSVLGPKAVGARLEVRPACMRAMHARRALQQRGARAPVRS